MKYTRMMLIILTLLLTLTSIAQSELDNTLTSPGGLTAQYPSSYMGEADEELSLAFMNLEQGTFLIIAVGENALTMIEDEVQNSIELKDSFVRTLEIFGGLAEDDPVRELQMNGRPAFIIPFATDAIGSGYFMAFELPDGMLGSAMLFGSADTEFPEGSVEELTAIVSTVALDPSLATVTDEETTDSTTEGEITETLEEDTIPEDAILLSDMPDDMILTGSGLQMNPVDGFTFMPGIEYIEDSVGLISSDFSSNIILLDTTMSADDLDIAMRTLALLTGREDFDPETDLQTVEVDGRTITYYAPTESLSESEESLGGLFYYFVDLVPDGDRVVTVQSMYAGEDIEEFGAKMLEFVQSIQLTEEEIARMEAPEAVDCWTQAAAVVDETTQTTTVTCPAGCDLDPSSIWGTDIYTNDSSVCVAAIHAGVIDGDGGAVTVTHVEGQSSYVGSTANGIISSEYGEWGSSFSVSVPVESE